MENEEVLLRVKEHRNILHTVTRRKAKWIGHNWRTNCQLKHVIEGKTDGRIEVTGRWGRRRNKLLDDLKEKRGHWKLKDEALDRSVEELAVEWGCGPVVRQTAERLTLLVDIKQLLLLLLTSVLVSVLSDRFVCEELTELLCIIEMITCPKATVTAKVKISAWVLNNKIWAWTPSP